MFFDVAQDCSSCCNQQLHRPCGNMAYFSYEHGMKDRACRFRDGVLQVFALHTFFTYPRYDDIREEGIAARLNCSHNKLRVTVAGRSREHTSAVRALPL